MDKFKLELQERQREWTKKVAGSPVKAVHAILLHCFSEEKQSTPLTYLTRQRDREIEMQKLEIRERELVMQ